MPEGPEVQTITDELYFYFKNRELLNVRILGGRYKDHDPPKLYDKFISYLPCIVTDIKCKGKLIFFEFKSLKNDKKITLFNTLGMSGHWTINEEKHSHIRFDFSINPNVLCDFKIDESEIPGYIERNPPNRTRWRSLRERVVHGRKDERLPPGPPARPSNRRRPWSIGTYPSGAPWDRPG